MTSIGEIISGLATRVFNVFKLGAASLVSRVLGTFGLTAVSLHGVMPALKEFIVSKANLLPPKALELISAVGLDVAFTMIVSALTIKLAFRFIIAPKAAVQAVTGQGAP